MVKNGLHFLSFISALFCFACASELDLPEDVRQAYTSINYTPDFNIHIRPLLSDRCFLCHGPDVKSRKAELDLSDRSSATAPLPLNKSKKAIVPGNAAKSELVTRILSTDDAWKMPPLESHRTLSSEEKALLIKWVEQGAVYKPHWAFISPVDSKPPPVKNKSWIKNDIDAFVLNKLESLGWKPNEDADKETLIRRVSLDITGLPPTLREIQNFVQDTSSHAYEKLVDRLLASTAYGEQMAVYWMDLARFADTHGYTVDKYRPAWPYRDWVIKSFNQNMPYDTFVTWQLAGDILPHPTKDQRLATAFNRLHSQNVEGGIVNEEFRVEYVMDRVNTFGTAFLGLTLECARCHDHKFDPFTQKNYYQLFSYFNNIHEAGQISWDDATPVPTMLLSTEHQDSIIRFIDQSIDEKNKEIKALQANKQQEINQWIATKSKSELIDLRQGLRHYYSFDQYAQNAFYNEINKKKDLAIYKNPERIKGIKGLAFQTNGDDVISFGQAGLYDRTHPFSISAWLKIPTGLSQGVILYKGFGEMLYNYRGYFLNLRGSRLELTMNRTWPYNSIIKSTLDTIPRDTWFHITMTYDGSSLAAGLQLYINATKSNMVTERDHLTKGILLVANGLPSQQPGLSFGADFRSAGIKGGAIDELRVYDHTISEPLIDQLFYHDQGKRNSYTGDWSAYYFQKYITAYDQKQKELIELHVQKNKMVDTIPEMMVMDEMDTLKPAFVLQRGLYHNPGERVYPTTPTQLFNNKDTSRQNRLSLARWLLDPKHPLTSRVLVNRIWQKYFGKGLVATSDNFGYQGSLPSHPELLDHLAVYMITQKWDLKKVQKYIVLSATYRQSSMLSSEMEDKDPENIWYSRGPVKKASAEMMRDLALASSGLLSHKVGGPSVKPYQPDDLWALSGATYQTDTGTDLYRKSLYTYWMRTNPPPSMHIFDAPSRSYCTVKREQTSTPLQSLVLLNDPQLLEACRALAYSQLKLNKTREENINAMYQTITGISPSKEELFLLNTLYHTQYKELKSSPLKTKGWLHTGAKKYNYDASTLAAYTIVASTIMNSDAYSTIR